MNQSTRNPNPATKSHLGCANSTHPDFQRRMGSWKEFEETNENEGHTESTFTPISASASTKKKKKKKILGERKSDDFQVKTAPKEKLVMGFDRIEAHPQETDPSPLMPHSIPSSSPSIPYDPVNNYTSPRPAFLRYNPDRRREILLRMSNEEGSVTDSGASTEEDSATSQKLSSHEVEAQDDAEDFAVDDAERRRPRCLRMVWKLLLLFGVFFISYHFLFPMNSSSSLVQVNVSTAESTIDRNFLIAHMGVSDVCLDIGEEMCGIEVDGALDSDEHESIDGETYEELVDVDGVENGEELDFEEENEEPASFREPFEQVAQAIEILSEYVEALDDQFDSDESRSDSMEEAQAEESEELAKSSVAPQSLFDDQESPILSETSSKDVHLIFISMSLLLTATTGVLTCIFKHYARSHQKSPSPVILPTDKPAEDWRSSKDSNVNEHKEPLIATPSSMTGGLRTEVKDSDDNNRLSSNYSAEELNGFYAIRQPMVELLGEFSIADDLSYKSAPSRRLKSEELYEVKSSLSSTKNHPASDRGHNVQENLEKREDTFEKSDAKKAVAMTPVRRSNRLRNRVNSPTP